MVIEPFMYLYSYKTHSIIPLPVSVSAPIGVFCASHHYFEDFSSSVVILAL